MPVNGAPKSFFKALFISMPFEAVLKRMTTSKSVYPTDSSHKSVRGALDGTNRPFHISQNRIPFKIPHLATL
jgi:hypothetical protein